ncbi:energy transducer TonB [bacterium]|nr:energy transducer TonB [bacterium]
MQARLPRVLVFSFGAIIILAALSQCAWFNGKPLESELVKPMPIGGYEILSTRIHYPRSIQEQGIEGTVTINALISEGGIVTETRIANKLNPELDRIAANAVQRTLFEPALRNGKPEGVWISIPIIFALSEWRKKSSPFDSFEMIVRPNAAYQLFDIEIHAIMKTEMELSRRFEVLLPINAEKSWVKTGTGQVLNFGSVRDETGEWLIFEVDDTQVAFGFNYRPVIDQGNQEFHYVFTMNHALPAWGLAVIYGEQTVSFEQAPDRIFKQDDGKMRFEYDLESLEAYELRYLEIRLK